MHINTINIHMGHSPVAAAAIAALLAGAEQVSAQDEPETSASILVPPAIGEYWEGQGGVYAGMKRGQDSGRDFCLIVPTDPRAVFSKRCLGTYGIDVNSAASHHNGHANTRALAEAGSELCKDILALEIDGHSDFYLPSHAELMLCWVNVPELFEKVWHLSSTQYSDDGAWDQYFDDGHTDGNGKKFEAVGRACRRLFL